MIDRYPMKTLSYRVDMQALGGISNNSSKTVLNTQKPAKIKSRETSKKEIKVVKMTSNKSVCSLLFELNCFGSIIGNPLQ